MSGGERQLEASSPTSRGGLLAKLLALGLITPTALHLVGRGGEGWWLVLLGLCLPWFVGQLSGGAPARRAGRVLAFAAGAALVVPVLPTLVRQFGFSYERVFFAGALSWLAWHGRLSPRASRSSLVWSLRSLVLAWAAWSTGSALYATWVSVPVGAPWVSDAFSAALLDPLGARSMVDPTQPMLRLLQRLELLLMLWAALEVALSDHELPRRLATALAIALPAGVLVNLIAVVVGFRGSHTPFATRLSSYLDRVFRPLPDHNALGSALVLAIPLAAWLLFRLWRQPAGERRGGQLVLALVALASGLALVVGTGSKSALLGLVVAAGVFVCLWILYARGRVRRFALVALVLGAMVPIGVQLLPQATLGQLMEVRYVRDVVRAARFDFVTNYLEENRYAVWSSATGMIGDAPINGVGLGRFPRMLASYHDPEAGGSFNPLQENAHNQYLQWAAEEGLVGAALGIGLLLLALLAGLRAMRARELDGSDQPERLGLCIFATALAGLAFNLLVGHALLVPAVGFLFAAVTGVVVATASRVLEPSETARTWPRFAWAWLVFIPVAASPALSAERSPLSGYQVGCYPWLWQPHSEAAPPFSRLLGPDARWIERWGNGSRMFLLAKSIAAPEVGKDQRVDVYVNGELLLEQFRLPRRALDEPLNPIVVIKVDAPEGVKTGDLVELRVVCDPPFAESVTGGHSQALWGPRVWAPTFKTPGQR